MISLNDGLDCGYYIVLDRFGDLVAVTSEFDDFVMIFNDSDGHHVITYPTLGDYYSSLF